MTDMKNKTWVQTQNNHHIYDPFSKSLSLSSTFGSISRSSHDAFSRQVGHCSFIIMMSQEHFQTCRTTNKQLHHLKPQKTVQCATLTKKKKIHLRNHIWPVPSISSSHCQSACRHRNRIPAGRPSTARMCCCDEPSTHPLAESHLNTQTQWIFMTFDPLDSSALKTQNSVTDINTVHLYHAKTKTNINNTQKHWRLLWTRAPLRWVSWIMSMRNRFSSGVMFYTLIDL